MGAVEWAVEVTTLRQWKAEAMEVLGAWEAVWEAAGRPGRIGASKADAVRDHVEHLQANQVTDEMRAVLDAAAAWVAAAKALQRALSGWNGAVSQYPGEAHTASVAAQADLRNAVVAYLASKDGAS